MYTAPASPLTHKNQETNSGIQSDRQSIYPQTREPRICSPTHPHLDTGRTHNSLTSSRYLTPDNLPSPLSCIFAFFSWSSNAPPIHPYPCFICVSSVANPSSRRFVTRSASTSLHQRFPNHLPKNRQNPPQDAQLQSTLRYLCSLLFKIHLLLNQRTENLLNKKDSPAPRYQQNTQPVD